MATEEPGIKPVVLYVNGEAVSTLNPLPATGGGGGGGGGGGIVAQGVGSGLPTGAWTVRISNGSGFLAPLTNTELRATPIPVSASALPLPTGAASETTLSSAVTELTTANANLTDIQTVQVDGTQRSCITDGTSPGDRHSYVVVDRDDLDVDKLARRVVEEYPLTSPSSCHRLLVKGAIHGHHSHPNSNFHLAPH